MIKRMENPEMISVRVTRTMKKRNLFNIFYARDQLYEETDCNFSSSTFFEIWNVSGMSH